jgi:hypothetical protein
LSALSPDVDFEVDSEPEAEPELPGSELPLDSEPEPDSDGLAAPLSLDDLELVFDDDFASRASFLAQPLPLNRIAG